jgi:hypothetical protein
MARKAWIAILGFGLLLFILLDAAMAWFALTRDRKAVGALLVCGFATWQAYLALRKRIGSTPDKHAL